MPATKETRGWNRASPPHAKQRRPRAPDRSDSLLRHAEQVPRAGGPFVARENPWPHLDQPRQQVEYRPRCPVGARPRAISLAVELFRHQRQRRILDDQVHHQDQRLFLGRILFQMIAVARDALAVGNIVTQCAGRLVHLPLPLDGCQLPAFLGLLTHIIRRQRTGWNLAYSLLGQWTSPPAPSPSTRISALSYWILVENEEGIVRRWD